MLSLHESIFYILKSSYDTYRSMITMYEMKVTNDDQSQKIIAYFHTSEADYMYVN